MSNEVVYSKIFGDLEIKIEKEEHDLYVLTAKAETERAKVDLGFLCGPDLEQAKLWSTYLAKSSRSVLPTLLKWSKDPNSFFEKDEVVADNDLGGTEGFFSSEFKVENGRLLYDLESACVGCDGGWHFDFGEATQEKIDKLCRKLFKYESDYLTSLFFDVKHYCIDNDFFGIYDED